ncbi:copper amine oxidase N-terminal domain-containing protein [Paenibacillus sedimenti]|uniref:Copper amine oxidase N-terminal domain-containing protein n=1 Tax=Paenibacillus sedimenti TaxID=2770274 RepID=A0A926KUK2_9BACL|nr:copper amine oxidase N-terminal domain-containing protein [Paenibacillus sedimenti]MBD0383583.1 copper amine oxidase N-terminal domain-containing protein [Paenibacillus sedimenti]
MRTWKKMIAVTMVACTLALPGLANAEEMMMPKFNYSGIETMTKDGVELVPLRQVAETLGFKVTWNGEKRSVTLMKMKMMMDDKKMEDKKMGDMTMKDDSMSMMDGIAIHIDSKTIMAGNMEAMLMYAPTIINDKTYVSKDFVDMYLNKDMMPMQ